MDQPTLELSASNERDGKREKNEFLKINALKLHYWRKGRRISGSLLWRAGSGSSFTYTLRPDRMGDSGFGF